MQPHMWGFLQPCLLLLLKEGPKHGYSLMEELSQRKLLGQDVDVGNLYRTLRRMEGEGLVVSAWNEQDTGPNKRVYQITQFGEESLVNWGTALEQRTSLIYNFLTEFHRIVERPGPAKPNAPQEPILGEDNPI
jgi:poly-beta-hydroxybutyrate-responsive repressor